MHPAFLFEDLHDVRIGRRLHCKMILVSRAPAEGFVQAPYGVPDGLLMVQMEGRGKLLGQIQDLRIGIWKVRNLRHGGSLQLPPNIKMVLLGPAEPKASKYSKK